MRAAQRDRTNTGELSGPFRSVADKSDGAGVKLCWAEKGFHGNRLGGAVTFKIKFGLFITPCVFIAGGGQMHTGTEPARGFQPPRGSLAQYPDPRLIRQGQRACQRGGCSRYPFRL